MKKVRFGRTEFEVSQIVLGCWGFGNHFFGDIGVQQVCDTVRTALDNGINMIDTAPNYGNSEDMLGEALKGIPRDRYMIATKTGNVVIEGGVTIHLSPDSMRCQLENSLRRMKTDYIDLYLIHWPDYNHSMPAAYDTMCRFQKEGKIRAWGVCNHKAQEVLDACDAGAVSVQNPYSLSRRRNARDIFPIAANADMGVEAYGILSGGLFTGKYSKAPEQTATERRSIFYTEFKEENWERSQRIIDAVKEVADGHGVSMAQTAINWVLRNPHVNTALVGAKTPQQVLDNIGAASFVLSDEEIAVLNAAVY